MRPVTVSLTPSSPTNSATAICASQTSPSSGNLILNGTAVSGGVANLVSGAGQMISIASTGNLSGVLFTINGQDQNGNPLAEKLAGPNNDTVKSSNFYAKVTNIYVSATVGTAVTVGTLVADGFGSPAIPLNWRSQNFKIACDVNFSTGAVATANIDISYHDPNDPQSQPMVWYTPTGDGGINSNTAVTINNVTAAVRLRLSAYTSGTVKLLVLSEGYAVGG